MHCLETEDDCGEAKHEHEHVLRDLREREQAPSSSDLEAAEHGEEHAEHAKAEETDNGEDLAKVGDAVTRMRGGAQRRARANGISVSFASSRDLGYLSHISPNLHCPEADRRDDKDEAKDVGEVPLVRISRELLEDRLHRSRDREHLEDKVRAHLSRACGEERSDERVRTRSLLVSLPLAIRDISHTLLETHIHLSNQAKGDRVPLILDALGNHARRELAAVEEKTEESKGTVQDEDEGHELRHDRPELGGFPVGEGREGERRDGR